MEFASWTAMMYFGCCSITEQESLNLWCFLYLLSLCTAVISFRYTLLTDKLFCPSYGLFSLTYKSVNAAQEPEFDSLGIKIIWDIWFIFLLPKPVDDLKEVMRRVVKL